MTVQELSDRLLELSHQHGLAQAEVCFVRDSQLVTVREVIIMNDNLVMLSSIPSAKNKEEVENLPLTRSNQTGGDWVVRDEEPL